MSDTQAASASLFWVDGVWHDTPPLLMSPLDHGFWQGSVVFDGARAIRGCAPDLDLHCARVVRSAKALGLAPALGGDAIRALAIEGIRRFPTDAEIYIKPVFYGVGAGHDLGRIGTRFVLQLSEAPLGPASGFSATLSPLRRPAPSMAPTDAKAGCLYPNSGRAALEAQSRGFDAAVMCDPDGNVAEFAFSNLWIARDGVALTPRDNRTFLAGITRARVMALLNAAGLPAREATLRPEDLHDADEIFSTGNYSKVVPCTRFEARELNAGPVAARARALYFDWMQTARVI